MRRSTRFLLALLGLSAVAAAPAGCASDSPAADAPPDAAALGAPADATPTDTSFADVDTPQDVAAANDAAWPPDTEVTPTLVPGAYRAIGGISMGAAALNIALRNPDQFSVVGALGGYPGLNYLVKTGLRLQLGGFCPLETLEANLDTLNDPETPIFCGPAPVWYAGEHPQDFNHLYYSTSGVTTDRSFYIQVFKSLTMAFGNVTAEPTGATPFLPGGVDEAWFYDTPKSQQCDNPPPIDPAHSYNAEYNPNGSYPVIPLCDQQGPKGPASSVFDPALPNTHPSEMLLAVDLNQNGRRDYGEPVFLNPMERFQDVGVDGCASVREDGLGGCLPADAAPAPGDPNGDDFAFWDNPTGTEGSGRFEAGEPYDDLGVDGVANTGDKGENNGQFDRVTAFERIAAWDAPTLLRALPLERLSALQIYIDAGIRDALHSLIVGRRIAAVLRGRGLDVTRYQGIAGRAGALLPDMAPDKLVQDLASGALSEAKVGRNLLVEYGDPNASQAQIDDGDGSHVGTMLQALNRLQTFSIWALSRLPNPDMDAFPDFPGLEAHTFYSAGLKARRRYLVALPPGYKADDRRYPTLYLLHGLGMDPSGLGAASLLLTSTMAQGKAPKAIQVYVDGTCCYAHIDTGVRECACEPKVKQGKRICVDPACTGPEDTCETRAIPTSELAEECYDGSLYFDLVTDRWGQPRDDLKYGQSVIDLVSHIDETYRTRSGALPE